MLVKEKSCRLKLIVRIFFIFLIFFFSKSYSTPTSNIIENLAEINTLTFDFEQKINDKVENGNCKIQYPKLIYCSYNKNNRKEMVSNGKSLVVKNNIINKSYIYPLKKTPLNYILDKEYLINQIQNLEPSNINNKFIEFKLLNKNNLIILFFNVQTFNLLGWKTIDIYQNEVEFLIKNLEKNLTINKDYFTLPKLN